MLKIISLMLATFMATTKCAYAYVDPATGSLVLQMLVAAFATALATIKLWRHKIKALFKKKEDVKPESKSK